MKTVLAASALMFLAGAGFAGECVGENLIAALPAEDQAWIRDRAEAVPYHQGILWRAEKGDAWISIVGTYHFDHAMHPATVARLQPDLAAAEDLAGEFQQDSFVAAHCHPLFLNCEEGRCDASC